MTATATASGPSVPVLGRRNGHVWAYDTSVHIWDAAVDEAAMRLVHRGVLGRLRRRGWKLQRDPRTAARFPSLGDRYWIGRRGDLRLYSQQAGRAVEVVFYQERNVENSNGGRYDFRKYAKMSAHERLQCVVEMANVVRRAMEFGYEPYVSAKSRTPLDADQLLLSLRRIAASETPDRAAGAGDPLAVFNEQWGADRFARDESGWPTDSVIRGCGWKCVGADGEPLHHGDVRYHRGRDGRLRRGRVYGGINDQWMFVHGGEITYDAGWRFFMCEHPEREPRRLVAGQTKRLRQELAAALERDDFRRVSTLAAVIAGL